MEGGPLEFVIRVLGGPTSAAEVKRVAGAYNDLAASEGRANATGKQAVATNAALSRAFKYTALGIIGVGAEALKMSVNYDAALERVHTQAGATQAEVDRMHGALLDMSGRDVMQGPQELAAGLYHLESIGLRGKKALDALHIAADGAAVGGANLEDTATALGSAWLVNIKGAGDLRHVMGVMNATVGAGNVRMEELVQALGTGILPAAKQAGLSLQDTMGALAVFTDEGYQASSAAAQFSTALHFLYNPTAKADNALKRIGLSGRALAEDMHKPQGLLVALRDLHNHLDTLPGGARGINAEQVLGDILPGGRGRIMLTLLNQLDRYQTKLKQIGDTSGNFAQDVAATQHTAAYKLHADWAMLQSDMTKLGQSIQVWGVPMLDNLAKAAEPLINNVLKPLGELIGREPGLLYAAIGVWGAWKAAAVVDAIAVRLAMSGVFGSLAAEEAAAAGAGTVAGGRFGLAAATSARGALLRFAWPALGGFIGIKIAQAIAHAIDPGKGKPGSAKDALHHEIRRFGHDWMAPVSEESTSAHDFHPANTERTYDPRSKRWVLLPSLGVDVTKRFGPPINVFGRPEKIELIVDGQVLARAMHRQTQSQQARGG